MEKKPTGPVPVALRRFLPPKIVAQGRAGAAELAAGLFKFLTPLAIPEDVPDWYKRNGKIHELLEEDVDWGEDPGGDKLFDALCEPTRKRALSHDSLDGLFYDDALYFDDS